jgi:putative ABC transport system substrate-binding protein
VKRRGFITLLGGAAAWPFAARAQQRDRMRRIGALMSWSETDPLWQSYFAEFVQELARLGWVDRRNARIDQRWSDEGLDRTLAFAQELIELQPDAILAGGALSTAALQRETRNIPIVFAVVSDPVGLGFVAGLPRPGGNITGFSNIEGAIAGKWLEMIKQIAPQLKRAALLFNPDTTPNAKFFLGPFEASRRPWLSIRSSLRFTTMQRSKRSSNRWDGCRAASS